MSVRLLAAILTAIVVASLAPLPAAGQEQPAASNRWLPARTPDGQPDLQGIWTMETFTRFQRPAQFAGKEFFTEQELAELNELLAADGVDPLGPGLSADSSRALLQVNRGDRGGRLHYDNAIWLRERQPKGLSTRRTSLIVDPPDGRIPPLTPEAKKREAERRKTWTLLVSNLAETEMSLDSYETRALDERCIYFPHEGPPMRPAPYIDRIQILQTQGYIAILQEYRTNQVRIIPLDGRPSLSKNIRQWPGVSRGRWEGETLVVDTTNFTHKTHFEGSSEALHVVERFTRVDADTILYEFTVEDPTSWTRPWSAEIPMKRADGPLFEWACHEGNHDLPNMLRIKRNLEAQQAAEIASPK